VSHGHNAPTRSRFRRKAQARLEGFAAQDFKIYCIGAARFVPRSGRLVAGTPPWPMRPNSPCRANAGTTGFAGSGTLIIGPAATGKVLADPAVDRRHQTPRRTGSGVRLGASR
jgi:hypothetical protein